MTKECSECNKVKKLTEFNKNKNNHQGKCRLCQSAYRKRSYIKNKDKELGQARLWRVNNKDRYLKTSKDYYYDNLDYVRNRQYLSKYGISLHIYNLMFLEQQGKCKICDTLKCKTDRRLAVDHCHTADKVRGLLCRACNNGIGEFEDNIDLLKKAIDYLS